MQNSEPKSPGRKEGASPDHETRGSAGISILPVSRHRKAAAPKPEIIEQIGHRLASVYNSVLVQPVPDRFLDLLAKLEAGELAQTDEEPAKKERK